MHLPRIIIAGTHSGVGKTTAALGLMGALSRQNLVVQGFKIGPDYIDGTYHTAITKRPSRNLDSFMAGTDGVNAVLWRGGKGADIAIMEGVMGYYDGKDSQSIVGSTADMADITSSPVILVVDVAGTARSAGAMVKGFQALDRGHHIQGVIVNRVGSPRHFEMVQGAIESITGIPVVGYLASQDLLHMPERHLGLVPAIERGEYTTLLDRLVTSVRNTVNLKKIVELAQGAPSLTYRESPPDSVPHREATVCIAVARDSAFNFYYQENLELLQEAGADIEEFSPLAGHPIPKSADALYLGGGFPEEFLEALSQPTLLQDFRKRIEQGLPTVAECGGLMFLGLSVSDTKGRPYPMVGAVPVTTAMQPRLTALGYRDIEAQETGPLLQKGERARGHEFHYSKATYASEANRAYRLYHHGTVTEDGFAHPTLAAGYVHHYFLSHPQMAQRFVKTAEAYRTRHL